MRRSLLALVLLSSCLVTAHAGEKSFSITGFVGTVGANLGTAIDGSAPNFAERDAFAITLRFETNQTPMISPAGVGETASYKLLESIITIYGDETTFTWTTAQNSVSHSFGITNDYFGSTDTFSSGGSLLGFTGPSLGVANKNFSHWNLQFNDFEHTAFSSSGIPTFVNVADFNAKGITLVFDGFMTDDSIPLNTSTFRVVPEPSTYAAIAGACALGFVAYRRRQRATR